MIAIAFPPIQVLLDGHPTDPAWTATDRWTQDYLAKHAGKVPVQVEHRTSTQGAYGQGDASKLNMKFGDVLKKLSKGDTSLYMTTQPVAPAPDGHPEIMAPPTSNLASDFPVQPEILGNLVPQQVNIWMGSAPEGSSTGLHVDFHDNLYVLIHGKKSFRLFSPSALPGLYLHGKATMIHPNGRIVFENQGNILPDGSEAGEVAAWKKKRDAEMELEAAEAAVARKEKGAKARLAAAEAAFDSVLEDALDDDAFGDFDDYEAMEMADAGAEAVKELVSGGGGGGGTAGEPDSFSQINFINKTKRQFSEKYFFEKFPEFPGIDAALEVEIEAGQSLYLPAGWFHEVTSYSGGGGNSEGGEGQPAFHLALNYWTHPPDVMDSSEKGFKKPYSSEYWPELWNQRKARYLGDGSGDIHGDEAVPSGDNIGKRKRDEDDTGSDEDTDSDSEEEEDEHEHGPHCGHGCDHHHHHHHHEDLEVDEDGWRGPTLDEKAHFLQGVRGMFGHGRRQHLYKFIGLRLRGRT